MEPFSFFSTTAHNVLMSDCITYGDMIINLCGLLSEGDRRVYSIIDVTNALRGNSLKSNYGRNEFNRQKTGTHADGIAQRVTLESVC